jgi:hypothetical protein
MMNDMTRRVADRRCRLFGTSGTAALKIAGQPPCENLMAMGCALTRRDAALRWTKRSLLSDRAVEHRTTEVASCDWGSSV